MNHSVGVAKDFIGWNQATSGYTLSQWFVLLLDPSNVIGLGLHQ